MNDDAIRNEVIEVLRTMAPEADYGSVSGNENLRDALDIDSFDFRNFVIGVRRRLGIEIPESDYPRLSTLEDEVRYVAERMK